MPNEFSWFSGWRVAVTAGALSAAGSIADPASVLAGGAYAQRSWRHSRPWLRARAQSPRGKKPGSNVASIIRSAVHATRWGRGGEAGGPAAEMDAA